ncbi:MAG: hypothetical protein K2N67_00740 [Mucispirillum sp.]|nr:hypothetical protein [Mucispirillum sp.]
MTIKIKSFISDFFEGAGQLLDITGSYCEPVLKKYLHTPSYEIDNNDIRSDWEAVGKDIKSAMELYNGIQQ